METREILTRFKNGELSMEEAEHYFRKEPFEEMDDYAKLDSHREIRSGFPEVIFCSGKADQHFVHIFKKLYEDNGEVFGTRASGHQYELVKDLLPGVEYDELSHIIKIEKKEKEHIGKIAICTAGTADIAVAEEAAQTAEYFGSHVERIFDVGVSGIHRLFSRLDVIQEAYGELNLKYYWNAHEPNYNVLANFQVESLEDFHGKKIRALGVWGDFLAALGASPTNIAGTEVYQALQLGTIDGALYGWSSLSDSNNIREVAQYALSPSMCFCQMATVVNQDSLNKLPEDLRSIVDETIRLANIGVIGQAHVVGTEKSVRDAIQGGYTELSPLPDDVLAEMREIAVTQTWEELAAKSERMARGIEIIKQQNRDYGRQVDY